MAGKLLNVGMGGKKSVRSWYKQYILFPADDFETSGDYDSYALGTDTTDQSATVSWASERFRNVRGQTVASDAVEEVTTSIDTFYYRIDDKMGTFLAQAFANVAELDDLKMIYADTLFEELDDGTVNVVFARVQGCTVPYEGMGGESTDGVNMPFTISKTGKPTQLGASGYDYATEVFTVPSGWQPE